MAMRKTKKKTTARTTKKKTSTRSTSRQTLEGSCQCGKITFTVDSETPVPFMFCFCSVCRKTGGGPFGANIMGIRDSLKLKGSRSLKSYHAIIREKGHPNKKSEGKRWFCGACGTHLYLTDERWPKGIWPYVGAIDTDLPVPEKPISLMTLFKPSWVPAWMTEHGETFNRYPKLSIAAWHRKNGYDVTVEP